MPSHNDYLKKFNRCILEYTNAAGAFDLTEAGEEDNIAPVQSADDPTAGADMGGMDTGGDMSMGGAPNAGAPDMGADPSAGSAPGGEESPAEPPQGFSPQGEDPQTGMDGMGGQPMSQDGDSDDELSYGSDEAVSHALQSSRGGRGLPDSGRPDGSGGACPKSLRPVADSG